MNHRLHFRFTHWGALLSVMLFSSACAATGVGTGPEDEELSVDAGFFPEETPPYDGEDEDEDEDPIEAPPEDEEEEEEEEVEPPFILGPGTDVVFIGDSWMNLTGIAALNILPPGFEFVYDFLPDMGIQQSVIAASDHRPYRTYGVPGTMFLDGAIPHQYHIARDEDPNIKTVVMTGGGNDILLDFPNFETINFLDIIGLPGQILHRINHSATANCALWSGIGLPDLAFLPMDAATRELVSFGIGLLLNSPLAAGIDRDGWRCREQIDFIEDRYFHLLNEMADDGVEDVVIVIYTRHTWIGHAPIDYVWERIAPVCESAPLRCHMIDSDLVNNGGPIALLEGIHPDEFGYNAIGNYVLDYMVNERIAR